MKRLFTLCAIVIAVAVSSCSKFDDTEIWDKLNDHESRITALEELCKQMNTNINALQTLVEALEKRDYITNVSPVRKDGEVIGYTISFADSDTITIYNGENGKDGYVPNIGVMKDTDGIYYWTLDGEWMLDGKGNKIQANGVDGEDGIDGVTPRLKIENDYWYVSYDEGTTWIELGKATGEDGTDGNDGVDGDSIFSSVTEDDEYVYFNLNDGTSIVLKKQSSDNIQFDDVIVKTICCKNWDTNRDFELSFAEAASVTDIGTTFSENTNIIAFDELKYFTGISSIPARAFMGCTSLCIVTLPSNIVEINEEAFYQCFSLYFIEIPENVTHIKKKAFYNCDNVNYISIPKSIVSVGEDAFLTNVTSKNVHVEDITKWCEIQFTNGGSNPLYGGGDLYEKDVLIDELDIPNEVTKIPDFTFRYCTSLKSLTINDNVTSIGKMAFDRCVNLKNVYIGNGVTTIGREAFQYCSSLESVTIGENVSHMGYRPFCFNDKLSIVYCRAKTPTTVEIPDAYGWEGFAYASASLKIYVPYEYVEVYKNATGWKSFKSKIYGYDFENNAPVE